MKSILTILAVLSFIIGQSQTQPTSVMIRVRAKDAKFIGSSMGGAHVTIATEEGRILAEGFTTGSTGDTEKLMKTPVSRGATLADENTAGYLAELDIDKPTFVTIEAKSGLDEKISVSQQMWLIPGKDITGDGIILEIPGFYLEIISPVVHQSFKLDENITFKANVVMMCGCPITKGGLWNSDNYEVTAIMYSEGKKQEEINLTYSGETSTFTANINLPKGTYLAFIYAFDANTGNTGLDKVSFSVN